MTATNARNDWDLLEEIYSSLPEAQGLIEEMPVNPNDLSEYDYEDAITEAENSILASEFFPTLRIIQALGRAGYLDDDRIWDELTEAAARGITRLVEERWEESLADIEDDGDDW